VREKNWRYKEGQREEEEVIQSEECCSEKKKERVSLAKRERASE
jgi:hypothetical protein